MVPLLSSTCPRSVEDFDVVEVDGRPLVVCACNHSAAVWSPADDRWTEHELADEVEVTAIGATVAGGRIVVGGGGEHQGFAQWYLDTGAARAAEQDDMGGVSSVATVVLDGRTWFVSGGTGAVIVLADPVEDVEDPEFLELFPSDHGSYAGVGAVAAGTLADRAVLVSGSGDGEVWAWDVQEETPVARFPDLDSSVVGVAMVAVAGRPSVVAAGDGGVFLGDPDTGQWEEPLSARGSKITCMDVAPVLGRQVAVAGAEDGTVHAWDLEDRRSVVAPFAAHDADIRGIRVIELHGRPAVVTSSHAEFRVWTPDHW